VTLRFLTDESCDFAVERSLRSDGHDVLAVGGIGSRTIDRDLIEQAYHEKRILLTEDKDFGWLVFVSQAESAGVILIRFPGDARKALVQTVKQLVSDEGDRIQGAFVVLQPGSIRISQHTRRG
jgi:predicted nuclease of predicted toxin-antitoxin system